MTISATVEADLAIIPNIDGVSARTVVALPPSDADPVWDEMRIAINGVLISRAFDPGADIVTGAPIALVSMSGEALVTMTGEPLVTMVLT